MISENLLSCVLNLERRRGYPRTRLGCLSSSGVHAVDLLQVARRLVNCRQLQPRHSTETSAVLARGRICGGRRRTILATGEGAQLHGWRVEVEEWDAEVGEEVMAADLEVGRCEEGLVRAGEIELECDPGDLG